MSVWYGYVPASQGGRWTVIQSIPYKKYYYGELFELIRLQSSHVALASQPTNAKHVLKSRKNDSELWPATPM